MNQEDFKLIISALHYASEWCEELVQTSRMCEPFHTEAKERKKKFDELRIKLANKRPSWVR